MKFYTAHIKQTFINHHNPWSETITEYRKVFKGVHPIEWASENSFWRNKGERRVDQSCKLDITSFSEISEDEYNRFSEFLTHVEA